MKGDVIIVEQYHIDAAEHIVQILSGKIKQFGNVFCMTIAGESGSGKSEVGKAIIDIFNDMGINSILLGQDDYFTLPPKSNDAKRHMDSEWLGPHKEVKLSELDKNLADAQLGQSILSKPVVDYNKNVILNEKIDLQDVKVIVVEGTYTSLLKNADIRIFIDQSRSDTAEHRHKRNRGNEFNDPFVEEILKTEHKIIAGHKQLADIIITKEYKVFIPSDSLLNK